MRRQPRLYNDMMLHLACFIVAGVVALIVAWASVRAVMKSALLAERQKAIATIQNVSAVLKQCEPLGHSSPAETAGMIEEVAKRADKLSGMAPLASEGELDAAGNLASAGDLRIRGLAKLYVKDIEEYARLKDRCGVLAAAAKEMAKTLNSSVVREIYNDQCAAVERLQGCSNGLIDACRRTASHGLLAKMRREAEKAIELVRDSRSKKKSDIGEWRELQGKAVSLTNEIALVAESMRNVKRDSEKVSGGIDDMLTGGVRVDDADSIKAIKNAVDESLGKVKVVKEDLAEAMTRVNEVVRGKGALVVSSTNQISELRRLHGSGYVADSVLSEARSTASDWNRFCSDVASELDSIANRVNEADNKVNEQKRRMESMDAVSASNLKAMGAALSARKDVRLQLKEAMEVVEELNPVQVADRFEEEAERVVGALRKCEMGAKDGLERLAADIRRLNAKREGLESAHVRVKDEVGNLKRLFAVYRGGRAYSSLHDKLQKLWGDVSAIRIPPAHVVGRSTGMSVSRYTTDLDTASARIGEINTRVADFKRERNGAVASGEIYTLEFVKTDASTAFRNVFYSGNGNVSFYVDIPDAGSHRIEVFATKKAGVLSSDTTEADIPIACCLQQGAGCISGQLARFDNFRYTPNVRMSSLYDAFGKGRKMFSFSLKCTIDRKELRLSHFNWILMDFTVCLDGKPVNIYKIAK